MILMISTWKLKEMLVFFSASSRVKERPRNMALEALAKLELPCAAAKPQTKWWLAIARLGGLTSEAPQERNRKHSRQIDF